MFYKREEGFTLIELLVVIGIIGILAAIVLVAVNPGRQFAQARNAQRKSDLLEVTNALYQFASEHNGNLPDLDSDDTASDFPVAATCVGTDAACYDLANTGAEDPADPLNPGNSSTDLLVPTYLAQIPVDPSAGDDADTGYTIMVNADGRVVVDAPNAEMGATISITR
jgi:prepilin-type N-terminal cleavage/methylation domain-containing protein